jgi:hypothetical protein
MLAIYFDVQIVVLHDCVKSRSINSNADSRWIQRMIPMHLAGWQTVTWKNGAGLQMAKTVTTAHVFTVAI